MEPIPTIGGGIRSACDRGGPARPRARRARTPEFASARRSRQAISEVDDLQKRSEAAQQAFARGEPIELHDVLIRVEEAEIAFKAMMEVRNKLVTPTATSCGWAADRARCPEGLNDGTDELD